MINQFDINPYTKNQLTAYLESKNINLREGMDNEETNKEIAAILHAGFPKMVQKIYSLAKFEKFFWEKRELLHQHIANRFTAIDEKAAKKGK
ncbi:hypothetical protein [Kingella oralis]|mgnify:FL=1|uniref:Uncharacterized protein n=1 Tax=Kingella oralis ATCC 51147 TaxID=629741 RepID=C4GH67_9NEIS|nr:hypothetical protein [Kingella oralis]EEP68305.1 hypothetical protein GCWU000324_00199 [Kingella oralis ATCC 51147]QMT42333.1 hypothetical protein H3L93_10095 [Kingella oralis]